MGCHVQREEISNSLIVSCQPVPGGPMDNADFVVGFAKAALDAGAKALRIESVAYVKAVRPQVAAAIIGIVKRDLDDSPVRITPFIEDAEALADAGADVVAFDATDRVRPVQVEALVKAVRAKGKLTMADCSSLEDAERALAAGVDFVGTTLSGYVGGPEPVEPDVALIAAMRRLTPYVIAEGRIRSPEQAAEAVRAGAYAVVVGSAITRTEHVTSWFHDTVERAFTLRDGRSRTMLAIDIGGTKTMAALVKGSNVIEEIVVATEREAGPDAWLAALAAATGSWRGRYTGIGIAVTGFIQNGLWSALNPATLGIPDRYPLVEKASALLAAPAFAVNDAQAAAWGEYRFGAGRGGDLVFLTISTGIGGGIVVNGRVLTGLAGHFGLIRSPSQGVAPIEDETSGRWMAAQAKATGHETDAAGVFAEARKGADWASAIVSQSAFRVATLCRDIQMMLDPKQIVIGGGIGLAEGYLGQVGQHLAGISPRLTPHLVAAKLGGRAGIIGAADLAGEGR
ncbi:putative N-acetylmannosamine-6-phosphate 2-epimerase [Rhizobium sp. BK251]|uniref:putative N-acetylmannosamine-6-phosphate 2-epimerase n=1 Tax=Rhizobium sp. BK251 TaxID=2512125 RepID=UPI0010DC1424|nr:putative N-acetylmannosamine-6-phosphate 2-epimerase [Rhizobium sp. BK251]TCL64606.1 N-acetylmannosamine-6-phosphate 2-epimerase/N-acetylmannosamine kinase [Rhizobium sp. BK251]